MGMKILLSCNRLGKFEVFLGIKVVKSRHGIFILQRKYVFDLLKGTRLLRYKAIDKSVDRNNKLGKNSENGIIS
jgi:hypothetical protein